MSNRLANQLHQQHAESRTKFIAAVATLSEAAAREAPGPGEWTAWEVVAHMPEVDYFYLQQALAARNIPGSAFHYFDDERWNRDRSSLIGEPSFARLLQSLARSHIAVTTVLLSFSDAELARPAIHPRGIPYTVADIFRRFPTHDQAHTTQVQTILVGLR